MIIKKKIFIFLYLKVVQQYKSILLWKEGATHTLLSTKGAGPPLNGPGGLPLSSPPGQNWQILSLLLETELDR